ncbi:hypothetical protein E6C70_08375 [Glaciibacter flavus]|uniref:Metal-independent alpha-mannosidase n=1 Tax=Orlajensenia flava TaxID=2565934 RepID=A0A4S4FXA4_9MICO|nr:glycoside hydrolase family 125 protein [Glaciibacter flavus]THG34296.1 hypothetical protein E6C70_08375 [Glaciibacter flavus]
MTSTESLTTFAPVIDAPETLHPTGNLLVSLPELDEHGVCRSIGIVSEAERGVLAAVGGEQGVLAPSVTVDGSAVTPSFTWTRVADWVPHAEASVTGGIVTAEWVAPLSRGGTSDAGVVARLSYRNETDAPQHVDLRWSGQWASTVVHHFRAKQLAVTLATRDDPWTGARAVYAGAERLLLAVSWRPGAGAAHDENAPANGWAVTRSASVAPGETLDLDVYVGVAPEPDGSGATALHLRRRGFDALRADTRAWLSAHGPRFDSPELTARARLNLFFCFFYGQADCLDTGRTVALTSRSPRYYVSGAFWSRDVYWWAFPAVLLTDATRARRVLVASIENAGEDIAQHALYITGGRLYPGFELDELCIPLLALWRYVDATGDRGVVSEPAVQRLFGTFERELAEVFDAELGLYGTMLLPTDDPTDHPFTATNNALVAVALRIVGRLTGDADLVARGEALAERLAEAFVHEAPTEGTTSAPGSGEHRWAWAIDADGEPEWREEPPLSLRTLAYWGVVDETDAAFATTLRWLVTDYAYHYDGPFPGAGAPHFASPSAFDLGNRMLTGNADLGDPVAAFVATPMDTGIACESWHPDTGIAVTGAAMASVAGFVAWTAWADAVGHRQWDDPFPLPGADGSRP